MTALSRFSIAHPKTALLLALVVTSAAAPGVTRLRLRTDGHALIPLDAPEIQEDRRIRREFGVEDPLVVLIKTAGPRGIFNTPTLELVRDLTHELQAIEGIRPWDVVSLETAKSDRVRPGTLIFRRFLEPIPDSIGALEQLRSDLQQIALYTGTLVSKDQSSTAVLVGVPAGMDRTALYETVRKLATAKEPRPEEIHVIGAPVAEALLGTHLLEDLGVPDALLGHLPMPEEATPFGVPRDLGGFRRMLAEHVGLVPVALALMCLVFAVSFRNVTGVALPMGEVGACLAFVFGLMGWFDVPVYLTIAVMPVILTAVGVADEIHIFAAFRQQRRLDPGGTPTQIVTATMANLGSPVVKTSVTTAVGFLSFALSPIRPVQMFGLFTATGVLYCMLFSLLVVPAVLVLLGSKRTGEESPRTPDGAPEPTARSRLAGIVRRARFVIVALAFLVIAAAPFGVARIRIQDSWIDGFAPSSEFFKATTGFNEQFLGIHTLLIRVGVEPSEPIRGTIPGAAVDHRAVHLPLDASIDPASLVGRALHLHRPDGRSPDTPARPALRYRSDWDTWIEAAERVGEQIVIVPHPKHGSPKMGMNAKPGERLEFSISPRWLMQPQVLRRIERFETFVRSRESETVGGVLGPATYLATTEFLIRGRKAGSREIPSDRDRVKWDWSQYGSVRGEESLRQVVNEDYTAGLISVYMKNANFIDTKRLMNAVREYERTELTPHGMQLSFAGDVAVSQTLIRAIVRTQIISVLGSLLGILVVTTIMGRSLAWGALCVLPCAVAVLVNFAVMGLIGMPLGVATSMFSGMTLGIGVDFAIHLLERYRHQRERGASATVALNDAMGVAGPAIMIDGLAVAIGFGVLTLSQVPANARLGGLVVLSIVNCLLVTLLLVPALLSFRKPAASRAVDSG